MERKQKWGLTLLLLFLSLFVTMSCYIRPLINPPDYEIDTIATLHSQLTKTERGIKQNAIATAIPGDHNGSGISEQWTIDQCNAIQDVSIELSRFIENDDGNGSIVCAYDHMISNIGNKPIRLIYYDRYYPTEFYQIPSEWKLHIVFEPGQSSGITSNIFSNTRFDDSPPRYECFVYSIAMVYEIPECGWITEGEKLHKDILYIAEEKPILAPCTLLSPVSYSEAVPDISEGLRH